MKNVKTIAVCGTWMFGVICFLNLAFGQVNREVLKNAPTQITCDSSISMSIQVEFYRNKMPLSDQNALHATFSFKENLIDPVCKTMGFSRWYFVYGEVVVVRSASSSKSQPWKEGQFAGRTPDSMIAEFMDERTGKFVYLRKNGPFPIGEVH